MKQVNRKFLEEQVKKALKEQEEEMTGGEVAADLILGLPFGSPSSYSTVSKWLSDKGMYGWGPDQFYKQALEKIGSIEKKGARAPFSQLLLRFYTTAPVGGDEGDAFNPVTLNLVPREDVAKELVDVKQYGYSKIFRILKKKKSDKKKIDEVEKILAIMGHRNAISRLDESLEDIAESYGFVESSLSYVRSPWGSDVKFSPVTLFKWPSALEKAGMYKEWAKDIIKGGTSSLGGNLEQFIMFHFNGLENANFRTAMARLSFRSDLQKVAKAHLAYEAATSQGLEALMAITDITVTTATTAASIVAFLAAAPTAGASVPAGIGLKIAGKVGLAAVRDMLLKKTGSKIAKNAAELYATKGYKKTAGFLDNTFANLAAGFGPFAAAWAYDSWLAKQNDLVANNNEFFENYADKTEEERSQFFEDTIRPSYEYIAKQHSKAMTAAGFDTQYMRTRLASTETVKQAYVTFNTQYIKNLQNNIQETGKNLDRSVAQLNKIEGVKDKKDKAVEQINTATQNGQKIVKSRPPRLPIASAFLNSGVAAPQIDDEEEEPVEEPTEEPQSEKEPEGKESVGSDDDSSDDVLEKIKTFFGSNEKTSDQILKDIEDSLGSDINEQKDNSIISVNVGYKDALEYSKGTPGFSPEKTKSNIDKIAKLVKSKGKKAVFTPVPRMVNAPEGVDQEKFNNFARQINSHIKSKQYRVMPKSAAKTLAAKTPKTSTTTKAQAQTSPEPVTLNAKESKYYPFFKKYGTKHNIDVGLLMGIAFRESKFNPRAVSRTKDYGIMQVNKFNHAAYGLNSSNWFDLDKNIDAGTRIFKAFRNSIAPMVFGQVYKNNHQMIPWESLSEEEKDRMGLYCYNMGQGKFKRRFLKVPRDKEALFAALKKHYRSVYNMADYSEYVIEAAKKYGYRGSSSPSLSGASQSELAKDQLIIVGDSNAAGIVYYGKYKGKLNYKRDYVTLKGWSRGGKIYVDPKTREPLEPAIGAYRTSQILQKLKKFYDFKGENYKPSVAIVHMGYNDLGNAPTTGFNNIQKTVDFLRSKGVSDVRVIQTKGRNMKYDRNFQKHMKQLSDRLANELTGAKVIANNAKLSSDGVHFFGSYEKLYNDALAGVQFSSTSDKQEPGSPAASTPAAQPPEEQKFETNTADLESQISSVAATENFGSFVPEYSKLMGSSLGTSFRNTADMKSAAREIEKQDLTQFVKQRTTYLKAVHANNFYKWRRQYDEEIKNAGTDEAKKEAANKKIAWFHRPIFYVTLQSNSLRKFFGTAPSVSFGFEPNSNRVSASYRGRDTFYREDIEGNAAYNRFLKELALLRKAINTVSKKLDSFLDKAPEQDANMIKKLKLYIDPLNNIVNKVSSGLSQRGTEASRKAYLITILDLALRAT